MHGTQNKDKEVHGKSFKSPRPSGLPGLGYRLLSDSYKICALLAHNTFNSNSLKSSDWGRPQEAPQRPVPKGQPGLPVTWEMDLLSTSGASSSLAQSPPQMRTLRSIRTKLLSTIAWHWRQSYSDSKSCLSIWNLSAYSLPVEQVRSCLLSDWGGGNGRPSIWPSAANPLNFWFRCFAALFMLSLLLFIDFILCPPSLHPSMRKGWAPTVLLTEWGVEESPNVSH